MRSLRNYSQWFSYLTYSSVNYIYHVVHYILSSYLSYGWKFVPFDCLHPVPSPSPSPYGDYKSDLFFYEFVCLFLNYNWPTTLLVPITQHNGLAFLYISKRSSCCQVTVCHRLDIILIVFPLYISYRWLMYLELYYWNFLISITYFSFAYF